MIVVELEKTMNNEFTTNSTVCTAGWKQRQRMRELKTVAGARQGGWPGAVEGAGTLRSPRYRAGPGKGPFHQRELGNEFSLVTFHFFRHSPNSISRESPTSEEDVTVA